MRTIDSPTETSLAVIGAGVIGTDVAQVFAEAGYNLTVIDSSEHALQLTRDKIKTNLRLQGLFGRRVPVPPQQILERIVFPRSYESLHGVGVIIENVTEDWSIKRRLHEEIRELHPPEALVAVNTSVIPITRIASVPGTLRAPSAFIS